MTSQSLNLSVGLSEVFILNQDMKYDPSSVATAKKWIDTNNIVSTRKNKTIYVIKATNDWQANVNSKDVKFFGADNLDQWGTFVPPASASDPLNATLNTTIEIYGNFTGNFVGTSGSLISNLIYGNAGLNTVHANLKGNINVSSSLKFFTANVIEGIAPGLPTSINGVNVDPRTANITLLQANVSASTYNWNRLINANVNTNVVVNASTDPCDITGNAVGNVTAVGDAMNNELYRHQFSLKTNPDAVNLKSYNPIYMVRLERFGRNSTVSDASLSGSLFATKFTSAFYANVANIAPDNIVYSNSLTNLSNISITGNINGNRLTVMNGNYNGNVHLLTPDANVQNISSSFNDRYSLETNVILPEDTISGNLQATSGTTTLFKDEKASFVQANIVNASFGVFLQGNVNLNSDKILLNGTDYTVVSSNTVFVNDTSNSAMTEKNPKIVTVFGSSLSDIIG